MAGWTQLHELCEAVTDEHTAWLSAAPKLAYLRSDQQPNRIEIYSRENAATLSACPGLYSKLGEGTA